MKDNYLVIQIVILNKNKIKMKEEFSSICNLVDVKIKIQNVIVLKNYGTLNRLIT